MSKPYGDFDQNTVVEMSVTTIANGNSVATTIANGNVIVFKDASNANRVDGVTLSVDWGLTGRQRISVNTAANNTFYSSGSFFDVFFANGNCNGTSLAGYGIGSFTIRVDSALKPSVAGRNVGIDANGNAQANVMQWAGVLAPALGAANGPVINGINAGNISLGHVTITASALNANGVTIVANGTGHGVGILSGCGSTGDAIRLVANSTTGNAVAAFGSGAANAVTIVGSTSGNGVVYIGRGGALTNAFRVRHEGGTASQSFKIDNDTGQGLAIDTVAITGAMSIGGGLVANIAGNMTGSVNTLNQTVNANVLNMAAGSITNTTFATNAIDAAALATDAVQEIRNAIFAFALPEITVDPGATPTFANALMLPYMGIRNLRVTSNGTNNDTITNDAGAQILTACISANATAFSKAKYG